MDAIGFINPFPRMPSPPVYKLSVDHLLPLKYAINMSYDISTIPYLEFISSFCSSFCHVSINFVHKKNASVHFKNINNYLLVTSKVPFDGTIDQYYNLTNLLSNLSDMNEQAEIKLRQKLEKDHEKVDENMIKEQIKYMKIKRKEWILKCAKEKMERHAITAHTKTRFADTIIKLYIGTIDSYDMNEWIDTLIKLEIEPTNRKDGSTKLRVIKIEVKIKGRNDLKYCFKKGGELDRFFPSVLVKGSFYDEFKGEGSRIETSLCLDVLAYFYKGMLAACSDFYWIHEALKTMENDSEISKKVAGLALLDVWMYGNLLRAGLTYEKYDKIMVYTADKFTPAYLKLANMDQYKYKSVVTTLSLPEVKDNQYNFKCFILDPVYDMTEPLIIDNSKKRKIEKAKPQAIPGKKPANTLMPSDGEKKGSLYWIGGSVFVALICVFGFYFHAKHYSR